MLAVLGSIGFFSAIGVKSTLIKMEAKYICVDGDGIVPTESAKDLSELIVFLLYQADGLKAVARVGVPGDHRGIIS
ncbi:hypothetical protein Sjap_015343 [Stephania japonica]|uniref:Uncharacterized protein n=1 Tax=Stephania japonica TaxID=461633 RepID=A0AAP0NTW7_9MAGN